MGGAIILAPAPMASPLSSTVSILQLAEGMGMGVYSYPQL